MVGRGPAAGPPPVRGEGAGPAVSRDTEPEGPRGAAVRGWPYRRWVAALCAVHVLAGLLLYEPTLFPGGDNAGYMILGEALRSGAGYVDLHLPDAPVHTKYPPLYPALLAVLGWAGGLQLFKLASLALTAGAVALTALLGRRWAGPVVGLAGGLVMALNPVLLDYSHFVLSEAPFLFLVLLSLWAAGRAADAPGDRPGGGAGRSGDAPGRAGGDEGARARGTGGTGRDGDGARWAAAALAAGAGAFLTRTAGLPLLVALALHPALQRRWRRAGAAAAVALVTAGGWALFQRLGAPGQAGYLQELLMVNPYEPAAGTVGAAGLVRRTAVNFWSYLTDVVPHALTGSRASAGGLAAAGGILVGGLAAGGWIRRCLHRIGPAELFLFLYVGTISAWPSVWTDQRFLLPALPAIVLYAVHGAEGLAGRVGRPAGGGAATPAAVGGLTALLLAGGAWSAARTVPERVSCFAAWRADRPCVAPAYASFFAAARWARDHTPADAVIVNRKPRIFYWIARRRGDVYPYSSEPRVVMGAMEEMGADYVVVDAVSGTTGRYLVPAVEAHGNRFEVVYREGRPPTWILRFMPPPGTALLPRGEGPPEERRGASG